MSTAYITALEHLKEEIATKEAQLLAELLPLKATANQLCKLAGLPEEYDLGAAQPAGGKRQPKFKEDQFFNKPLAGSVAAYLEAREELELERPASIDEIYDALASGGYKFEGATGNPDNSKRALKIALTKNTAQFVKIGEKFALKKWYNLRSPRKSAPTDNESHEASTPEDSQVPPEQRSDEATGTSASVLG